ncbi:hypothetical protein BRD18_08360 [Halobacteriales archaeon SW_7_71_33]|nr:MAG: hypothetical protein BRD18_08360 [Halobacteriales archaeon SW_7_71_33]
MSDDAPDPGVPGAGTSARAMARWETVIEDMAATAAEYESEGWETLQLHPGDVTVLPPDSDTPGLDVLVPDDEHRDLAALMDDHEFVSSAVFRRAEGSMVYLLVVEESTDDVAVLYPVYYSTSDRGVEDTFEHAHRTGRFRSFVRRLQGDPFVFEHDDPAPFAP